MAKWGAIFAGAGPILSAFGPAIHWGRRRRLINIARMTLTM